MIGLKCSLKVQKTLLQGVVWRSLATSNQPKKTTYKDSFAEPPHSFNYPGNQKKRGFSDGTTGTTRDERYCFGRDF